MLSNKEKIFEIYKLIVLQISPTEISVFDAFKENAMNLGEYEKDWEKTDLGFGLGEFITFLTPWIIFSAQEAIKLLRDLMVEMIKNKIELHKRRFPLSRASISPDYQKKLEGIIYESLQKKGFKGRDGRRIAKITIETLMFDKNVGDLLNEIIENL
jgi:hypothetical protein